MRRTTKIVIGLMIATLLSTFAITLGNIIYRGPRNEISINITLNNEMAYVEFPKSGVICIDNLPQFRGEIESLENMYCQYSCNLDILDHQELDGRIGINKEFVDLLHIRTKNDTSYISIDRDKFIEYYTSIGRDGYTNFKNVKMQLPINQSMRLVNHNEFNNINIENVEAKEFSLSTSTRASISLNNSQMQTLNLNGIIENRYRDSSSIGLNNSKIDTLNIDLEHIYLTQGYVNNSTIDVINLTNNGLEDRSNDNFYFIECNEFNWKPNNSEHRLNVTFDKAVTIKK